MEESEMLKELRSLRTHIDKRLDRIEHEIGGLKNAVVLLSKNHSAPAEHEEVRRLVAVV